MSRFVFKIEMHWKNWKLNGALPKQSSQKSGCPIKKSDKICHQLWDFILIVDTQNERDAAIK